MGSARKYIITVSETKPNGVYTTGITTMYDLTNAFSGIREDDSTFSYDSISLLELSQMSDADYEQRVEDFLIFIDVKTIDERESLLLAASYNDPNC